MADGDRRAARAARKGDAVFGSRRSLAARTVALALAGMLAACAPGTPYAGPDFPFAARYRAGQSEAPVLLGNAEWWRGLKDPALDRLVALALADSLSLDLARARITEARAGLAAVPGAVLLSPSIGIEARDGSRVDATESGTARLSLAWMLDPYGARREALKASGARIEVADAERDAAQLLVLSNVADAYVDLRYRQRILALSRQELASRRQTLALTEDLLAASSATTLEVTRTRARLAEIQSQLPGLEAAIPASLNRIAVLAGYAPGTLPQALAQALAAPAPQPRPALAPDVGIPADLLRNRPDIRIAERSYYAAVAETGQARAGLYPTLSLGGAITLNALDNRARGSEYFFGPTVQFPSFPGTAARAVVDQRAARAQAAHISWKTTVLGAILEVENALLDYGAVSASLQSATRASGLYREARGLTRDLFARGAATLGDLIDADEALATSDRALEDALLRRGQSFVALNVRLGSGSAPELSGRLSEAPFAPSPAD